MSSKHLPASGRVCSCLNESVCPSSCLSMPVKVNFPGERFSADLSIRTFRCNLSYLGKNARARYYPLTSTGRTSNMTSVVFSLQSGSSHEECINLTSLASDHALAASCIAATTVSYFSPNEVLIQ